MMHKKTLSSVCLLATLLLPLLATCNAPFVFENPIDLGNPNYVHLAGISLDRETITLVTGLSTKLVPSVSPANAFDKRIEWTTSNAEVATVDSVGLVYGVTPGKAVIEARSVGKPAIKASCTVTVVDASSKEITGFSFSGLALESPAVIDHEQETISLALPHGTNLANLVATFTFIGTQVRIGDVVQISGSTPNDFTNPVSYTVVAEDGSTRNYVLTIQLISLTTKEISSFSFTIGGSLFSGSINNSTRAIVITLPFGTNRNGLIPAITHVGKSINPASGIARDFSTPKTYTVSAFDDSSHEYTVTVNIANAIVSFDADGGMPAIQTYMVEHPATTTGSLPDSPTRTNYSFSGWRTGRNGGGTAFSGSTTITGDTTVYAHWIPDSYTITYTLNGGTNHADNPGSYTIETATITLQVPSRSGYDFLGWYDNEAFSGDPITQLEAGSTGGRTYHAKWSAKKSYAVTFDKQSGTGGSDEVSAIYDQPMPAATAPTRSGYSFGGYYSAAGGGGTQYYSPAMTSTRNWNLAADTILYASWIPVSYSISYTLNGGTNHSGNPAAYTIETSTIILGVPNLDYYDFNGWYDNPSFTGSVITQIAEGSTGNKALYAKWTGKPYTVTFDKQSGSGGTNSVTATYGEAMPAATAPARDGYSFGGYYTATGGGGTQYYSAAMASLRNWDLAENRTLYAKWTIDNYTVSYDGNGSTRGTVPVPGKHNYDANVIVAEPGDLRGPAINSGITQRFLAWNTKTDGTGTSYQPLDNFPMPADTVTLYAIWTSGTEVIGKVSPAGGKVFYDKGNYTSGWRYLEAWTADEYGTYQWKTSNTTTSGTSTAIGTGYTNTYTAMAGTIHPAAEVARNARHGSEDDWFLPSKDELNQMYIQRSAIDSLTSDIYWASSELDSVHAWGQDFDSGYQGYPLKKDFSLRVRVVRAFRSVNPLYIVSYHANGATSGSVPVDYGMYETNETGVPIAANSGSLARSGFGFTFVGWNTKPDGSGTHYAASSTTTMPSGNLTLYAEWQASGLAIGATGPAGGKVFYDKGNYSDGWRYFEAWTADEGAGTTYQWKTTNTETAGTVTAIGTGHSNTMAMAGTEHPAAEVCRNAAYGGYTDWFLPSKDELNQIYIQRSFIGGFASDYYWSSSEYDSFDAWLQYFGHGPQDASLKDCYNGRVRVVRAF